MNRKLFVKAALVGLVTVGLIVPLALIHGVVLERGAHRHAAAADVARTWTGPQRLLGPVLTIGYEVEERQRLFNHDTRQYSLETTRRQATLELVPDDLSIDGDVTVEKRWRGIYGIPVYTATLALNGRFDTQALAARARNIEGFARWLPATLSLNIGDVRGIHGRPRLVWGGQAVDLAPTSRIEALPEGLHARLPAVTPGHPAEFEIELTLRGSQTLSLVPLAGEGRAALRSAWPHPKFSGHFLPIRYEVSGDGFSADWQTSAYSTGVAAKLAACLTGQCAALVTTGFSVEFIETADVYQKVTRATKYGMLFIVLTFAAFSLSETLGRVRVHPMQYALVGAALAVFFLLLISLSEHLHFVLAYLIAAAACAGLIGVYVAGAFRSARQGVAYGFGIALLYLMLYAILRSEDFALLMGSLLLFAMLAVVMLTTRRLDWYAFGRGEA